MPLVPGGLIRRAHDAAAGRRIRTALADSGAPVHRRSETGGLALVRHRQSAGQFLTQRQLSQTDRLVEGIRVDDDTGIEQMLRIEETFDLGKQIERRRGVHEAEQFGPGPTVPMLPGDRPAVAGDELRGRDHEIAHHLTAVRVLEWEVHAHVQAAVTEVPIGNAPQPVLLKQLHEVMKIIAEVVHRNRRILPSCVGVPSIGGA